MATTNPTEPQVDDQGYVVVPPRVYAGITAVRESGQTNMLDVPAVEVLLVKLNFADVTTWIHEHQLAYTTGIFQGFVSAGDDPAAATSLIETTAEMALHVEMGKGKDGEETLTIAYQLSAPELAQALHNLVRETVMKGQVMEPLLELPRWTQLRQDTRESWESLVDAMMSTIGEYDLLDMVPALEARQKGMAHDESTSATGDDAGSR